MPRGASAVHNIYTEQRQGPVTSDDIDILWRIFSSIYASYLKYIKVLSLGASYRILLMWTHTTYLRVGITLQVLPHN